MKVSRLRTFQLTVVAGPQPLLDHRLPAIASSTISNSLRVVRATDLIEGFRAGSRRCFRDNARGCYSLWPYRLPHSRSELISDARIDGHMLVRPTPLSTIDLPVDFHRRASPGRARCHRSRRWTCDGAMWTLSKNIRLTFHVSKTPYLRQRRTGRPRRLPRPSSGARYAQAVSAGSTSMGRIIGYLRARPIGARRHTPPSRSFGRGCWVTTQSPSVDIKACSVLSATCGANANASFDFEAGQIDLFAGRRPMSSCAPTILEAVLACSDLSSPCGAAPAIRSSLAVLVACFYDRRAGQADVSAATASVHIRSLFPSGVGSRHSYPAAVTVASTTAAVVRGSGMASPSSRMPSR